MQGQGWWPEGESVEVDGGQPSCPWQLPGLMDLQCSSRWTRVFSVVVSEVPYLQTTSCLLFFRDCDRQKFSKLEVQGCLDCWFTRNLLFECTSEMPFIDLPYLSVERFLF